MHIQQANDRKRFHLFRQKQYSSKVLQIVIFFALGLVSILFNSCQKLEETLSTTPNVQLSNSKLSEQASISCPIVKSEPDINLPICIYPTRILPVITKRAYPIYPLEAKKASIEGLVVAKVLVNKTGHIDEIDIIKSIPRLDKSAIEAVKQFQFKPAKLNDLSIKVWVSIPFHFKINK